MVCNSQRHINLMGDDFHYVFDLLYRLLHTNHNVFHIDSIIHQRSLLQMLRQQSNVCFVTTNGKISNNIFSKKI